MATQNDPDFEFSQETLRPAMELHPAEEHHASGDMRWEPVALAPAMAFDMRGATAVPVARLSLRLDTTRKTGETAIALSGFVLAANRLEMSLGGAGLRLGPATEEGDELRFTLTPVELDGATERLENVIRSLRAAGQGAGDPFRSWDATVESPS